MKIKLGIIVLICMLFSACADTSRNYVGRKPITQGIDYSRGYQNDVYYEFTSFVPPESTIVEETTPAISESEEALGEDEDFTSDMIASTAGQYGDVVVTVATKKFKLGASATKKEMTLLQESIDVAYSKALRTYRAKGFTYSISSVGSVNPLSDVEVSCKLSEQSANEVGQSTCNLFFDTIRITYIKKAQEAKSV